MAEVARCTQYAAFGAIVARQDPKAVRRFIKNNVVDVADGTLWKGVGNRPRQPMVRRTIHVNPVAVEVVEILSPIETPIGGGGDVQRTRAALNSMSDMELAFAGSKGNDCSSHRSN